MCQCVSVSIYSGIMSIFGIGKVLWLSSTYTVFIFGFSFFCRYFLFCWCFVSSSLKFQHLFLCSCVLCFIFVVELSFIHFFCVFPLYQSTKFPFDMCSSIYDFYRGCCSALCFLLLQWSLYFKNEK